MGAGGRRRALGEAVGAGWLRAEGRQAGCSRRCGAAGGEVASLSAVLAFIKMGEVGGDSLPPLAESQHQEGGGVAGAWEGLRHGWGV